MKTQVHLKELTKSEMVEEFHKPTNPLRDAFVPEGERALAQAVKNAVMTLTGICRHDEKVDAVIEIDTTESLSVIIGFKKIVPVAVEEPKKGDAPPADPPAEVGP